MPLYSAQEIIDLVKEQLDEHVEAINNVQDHVNDLHKNHSEVIIDLQKHVTGLTHRVKTLELDLQAVKSAAVIHEHRDVGDC